SAAGGRANLNFRGSRDRCLVLDAKWNIVGVDAVDPERLQEEPLRRVRRSKSERLEADAMQGVNERRARRLEKEEIGLDHLRPNNRGRHKDFVRRTITGKAKDGPDFSPLQAQVEFLVDKRNRKAKLFLDFGRREELQPEDPEVPGDFRGMLSREVEERGRE